MEACKNIAREVFNGTKVIVFVISIFIVRDSAFVFIKRLLFPLFDKIFLQSLACFLFLLQVFVSDNKNTSTRDVDNFFNFADMQMGL